MELAALGGPFVFLLLIVFGLLMAVLGGFLLVWSNGKPRIWGTGIMSVGIVVIVATAYSVLSGAFLHGVNIVWDVLVPAVIYLLAIAAGAVLAILPFLVAAIRS